MAACVSFPEGRSRRADQQSDVFTVAADWLSFDGEAAALFSGEKLTIRECGGEQGRHLGFNHLRSLAGWVWESGRLFSSAWICLILPQDHSILSFWRETRDTREHWSQNGLWDTADTET